ncbi:MAG: ADP-ribosylglycohydrolase family protein [Clostridiales bacterium]|nr:ADP-ribosylglycohydrolase family protein [Clostridiales bacterium]
MYNYRNELFDKVYGCLLGGLIGDAMGAPAEGKTYRDIKEKFGWIHDFKGSGTDDSAIRLILCEAIIGNDGYVTADEFAASFIKNKEKYYNLFYIPVKNMFHKIESKLTLPVYAGFGNMHSSSTAMSISPMGLINACNPRQAAVETFDVAGLIHAGDSTFCRDGACAMAAAIAEAIKPEATVDSVIEASTAYLHKTSSAEMIGWIDRTIKMAKELNNYDKFREKFYKTNLGDIISDSRETVPCALALFYISKGEPEQAILYGANFGRDADTIGTMAGGLAGAFKGSKGLKQEWVDKIEASYGKKQNVSKDYGINDTEAVNQMELAQKIVDIIEKRMEAQENHINTLKKLTNE